MFQLLAYRALRATHIAIHTVLWVYNPTEMSILDTDARVARFGILPTDKIWLAWCRVWLACAHGARGSVAAAIFGLDADWRHDRELRVRRMLRRTRIANRKARRELAQKQREVAEINRKIQAQYMDDNYASW